MEELLTRPTRVLKTSVIMLPPNTPHNTERNHFPNNSAPSATTRPPARKNLLDRAKHNPAKTKPTMAKKDIENQNSMLEAF
jgi:hypothetical protein